MCCSTKSDDNPSIAQMVERQTVEVRNAAAEICWPPVDTGYREFYIRWSSDVLGLCIAVFRCDQLLSM